MTLLGKQIKDLRVMRKLTQTELASRVGVTKSTIAAYENNSRMPSYEVLIKLADVFNVTLDSLVFSRSEKVLDVSKLKDNQIDLLIQMIKAFEKNNIVEKALLKHHSEDILELLDKILEKNSTSSIQDNFYSSLELDLTKGKK